MKGRQKRYEKARNPFAIRSGAFEGFGEVKIETIQVRSVS